MTITHRKTMVSCASRPRHHKIAHASSQQPSARGFPDTFTSQSFVCPIERTGGDGLVVIPSTSATPRSEHTPRSDMSADAANAITHHVARMPAVDVQRLRETLQQLVVQHTPRGPLPAPPVRQL